MSELLMAAIFIAGVLVGFAIDNMAYKKMLDDERERKARDA